jgi:hypothetical protein
MIFGVLISYALSAIEIAAYIAIILCAIKYLKKKD